MGSPFFFAVFPGFSMLLSLLGAASAAGNASEKIYLKFFRDWAMRSMEAVIIFLFQKDMSANNERRSPH